MSRLVRLAVMAWPWVMALFVCAPLLAPGYVLTYDMVWVPDLALDRRDVWGLGSALPRAVPSDALVGLMDEVVPAALLQKAMLVGALGFAGAGMARLLAAVGPAAQLGATSLYVWNPFVAERLGLGQWPLLVAYAAVPWLLHAIRFGGWGPAAVLSLAATALSPVSGLMGALIALVMSDGRDRLKFTVAGLALNAPWLVAGVLHGSSARSDASAVRFFDVQPEAHLGRVGAVFGLGGIWNLDVVPTSRTLWTAAIIALILWIVMVFGLFVMWREDRALLLKLGALGSVGVLVALSGWVATDAVASIAGAMPGGGLLRDGTRYLLLLAPLEAWSFGVGAHALARQLDRRAGAVMAAATLTLLPVVAMPDMAWGLAGQLKPVDYPTSWQSARDGLATLPAGDVLILPFTSYRQPDWNNQRSVLDPAGRFFDRVTVVNDDLLVSGKAIEGEDRRAAAVGEALGADDVGAALAAEGIGVVVVETDAGDSGVPAEQLANLDGLPLAGAGMEIYAIGPAQGIDGSGVDRVAIVLAWLLAASMMAGAVIFAILSRLPR
ncbi:MAG: hypothetical protein M3Q98_02630 [Actinomycetota bacterium]|nr:hypothetical protein [Actinomycetota bacterium]